jgi:tRNA G18 (ribose-2'-O)-methylase SpoU
MMIRSAVIFGAETFYIIGRKRYDKRSTVGAYNYIDLKFITDDPEETPHLALNDILLKYDLAFIEQGGKDINSIHFGKGKKDRCFVFGSESNGIPKSMLKAGIEDANAEVFSIPQLGVLRSLNVSNAASIVMHKAAMDLKPVDQEIL